jgi:D-glycero-alpha-D-manno-heptose-7-phosphate kinase
VIISRTPFRVSFVGGGSDLPAFCDRQPGAVLSMTIDKAMYLTLHPYFDRGKTLLRYSQTELVEAVGKIEHPIFREALRLMEISGGVEISSTADVPSGTGMGSSSSFTVGLLHVLSAYRARYPSKEYLGSTASYLEIDVLGEPIGRQDQYAAAYGGINVIEFYKNGEVRVEPVTIARETLTNLDSRLMMFYTGEQRATSSILGDQSQGVATNDEKFQATAKMVELVYEMRDALFEGDLWAFGEVLDRNWELKRSLSKHISNPAIDEAYARAREAGAAGGKLLGAGGGGFLLVYVDPEHQEKVREALAHLNELDFHYSPLGSSIVHTDGFDIESPGGFFGGD